MQLCTLYRVDKRCTQETVYSLGWEDMGVVVTLEEWTLVVGLADHAELAVVDDGGVKVILPDGGDIK